MNNSIWKSIGALLAGFVFVVVMSIATDVILEKAGILKRPFDQNTSLFILLVILYRNIYSVVGCYITAMLAPYKPMRHAIIAGLIGLTISVVGAIVMRDEGPTYYAVTLIILALPSAWLGGKLRLVTSK